MAKSGYLGLRFSSDWQQLETWRRQRVLELVQQLIQSLTVRLRHFQLAYAFAVLHALSKWAYEAGTSRPFEVVLSALLGPAAYGASALHTAPR